MKRFFKPWFPALLSGALLALSFPAWRLFPLAWVALVPLLVFTRDMRPWQAARRFLLAGAAFHLLLLQWLLANYQWAGGWAFIGYVLLVIWLSGYWAALGLLWNWLRGRGSWLCCAPVFALFWVAMEMLQARLLSGFGWGCLAHSQGRDLAQLQWAAVGGAHFVSAILVATNYLFAEIIFERQRRYMRIAWVVALVVVSHGVGALMLKPADYTSRPLQAGLLQPNYPLEMKDDEEYRVEMVARTATKSRLLADHERVDLFVWPESLVMDAVDAEDILPHIQDLIRATGAAVFTGSQRVDRETGKWMNSSAFLNAQGEILGHYDKLHLAPFGEYLPLSDTVPALHDFIPAIGDLAPGDKPEVFDAAGRRFGPLICFEVLFSPMAGRLREMGADMPVVITNLGWFGASSALPQELDIARVRAIETRLPLVHCANTGITGVFDPYGRFEGITHTFSPDGAYQRYLGPYKPDVSAMQRRIGALSVAAPGQRPVPHLPLYFPWAALALSALAMLVAPLVERRE